MSLNPLHKPNFFKKLFINHKFAVRTITTGRILRSACTLKHSPNAKLSKTIIDRYLCLPLPEHMSVVEYVWIDGTGQNLRSKARTVPVVPSAYREVPIWSYDGNSTYQGRPGKNSDIQLLPIALYRCPFRRGQNKIALCETHYVDACPTESNSRAKFRETLNRVCDHEVMWGLEQDYMLMDVDGRPLGWPPLRSEPENVPRYYSGIGADKVYGREIEEAHYRACLFAGVKLCGSNAESMLSQWQYQIGVNKGITGADDLWIARYIMARIAEEYGLDVSHAPKLFPNWTGSSLHVNFSTKAMRGDDGLKAIENAISKLKSKHSDHLTLYGLSGKKGRKCLPDYREKPGKPQEFTSGPGRAVSVRISSHVATTKKGHFEDRRPPANMDPYILCNSIVQTCLL